MKFETALFQIANFFPTEALHYFCRSGLTATATTASPGGSEPVPAKLSGALFAELPVASSSEDSPTRAPAGTVISGVIGLSLLFGAAAQAGQSVSLSWNAVTNSSAAGYNIYIGSKSGTYTSHFDVGTNTTITLCNLKECTTNYFTVAAYDTNRNEGPRSAESTYLVPGMAKLLPATPASGPAKLTFPVAVGHNYEVQSSPDLKIWTSIWQTGVSTSNAWVTFQDPQGTTLPKRFYRLVLH